MLNEIGDDVAMWQPSRSNRSVITTDALIENVHFRRDRLSMREIGHRALAANLSDVAAAGGRPVLATVALGIPPDASMESVLEIYEGMLALASRTRCALAGGDLSRSPHYIIVITVVGECRPSHFKGRGGARPGDVVALTGPLGASRAGLHLGDDLQIVDSTLRAQALAAHRTPQPRIVEGRWLAASAHVHAVMDVSDGLSTDLARMCERSGCGATIEHVPVAAAAAALARERGEEERAYALAGGEDFELLAAVAPRAFAHLGDRYRRRFGAPLLAAGVFREGTGVRIRNGNNEEPLAATGWDHFS